MIDDRVMVTQAQYARMRGVTPSAIAHRVKSGQIKVHGERKLIDVLEADAIIAENTSQARIDTGQAKVAIATGKAEKSVEGMSFHESRVMKMREDALRAAIARESEEISLKIKRGSVIPVEMVAEAWATVTSLMTTRIGIVPTSCAPRLIDGMTTAEKEALIRHEIDEALDALAKTVVLPASAESGGGGIDAAELAAGEVVAKAPAKRVGRPKSKAKPGRLG